MSRPTLTERGARAARIWPSDEPAEAFLEIIERRLRDARTPEERGFWQKIKEGFAGVPGSVTASLAVEVTKALGGIAFCERALALMPARPSAAFW